MRQQCQVVPSIFVANWFIFLCCYRPLFKNVVFFIDIHYIISIAVQLGLLFSHTEKYPDEPPLLNVKRCTFFLNHALSVIVIADSLLDLCPST